MRLVLACFGVALFLSGCARDHPNCQSLAEQVDRLEASGDEKNALDRTSLGVKACPAATYPELYWRFYSHRAALLNRAGQYDQTLAVWKQDPPSGPAFAHIRSDRLMDQAWVANRRNKYEESEHLLDSAEQEARQAGKRAPRLLADIDMRRILLYGDEQKFSAVGEAIARLQQSSGGVDRAYVFTTYGYLLESAARFEEAAASFEQALPAVEAAENATDLVKIYNNLGSAYYNLGDFDRSLDYTLKAEALLHGNSDKVSLRICLNTAGLIYLERGDFKKADEYLQRALGLSAEPGEESQVSQNLALAAIGEKAFDRAEKYNRRALELESRQPDKELRGSTLVNEARIAAGRRDFKLALATLDGLTGQPFVNPNPRIDAEREYISIYRELHDEPRARAHYQAAIALSLSVRARMQKDENKLAWYASQISLNEEWVRFLIEAHHPGEALEAVEASRARLMTERIGTAPSSRTSSVAAYRRLARFRGAALVSYWLMPEMSYVWVVRPDRVEMHELPGESRIASLVESYQGFLEARRDPLLAAGGPGEQLRKAVLDPIQPALAGVRDVILVPDGPLHAVNFETFPGEGKYWIDDVTLTLAPSLNILSAATGVRPKAGRGALLIGDAQPTAEFPKLPDAGRELEAVSALFPGSKTLRGAEATPAAYLNAPDSAAYIHFAAHAQASAERPLDSAVILSGGRLTAHDLLGKPIHAELVTISACRSAGLRSYRGEGMVGFAWVFLQTGAHSVIAGLWDASDSATADVMGELYRRVAQGEAPASALREAKLKLIHGGTRFERPFYWAPFQYYQGAGT